MALIGITLVVLVLVGIANLLSNLGIRLTEGSPAKDSDILEMFEKHGEDYNKLTKNWEDLYNIEVNTYDFPRIKQNKSWYVLYPYSINGVGVAPRWYKSKKVIDAKFAELIRKSNVYISKRKKLGLD